MKELVTYIKEQKTQEYVHPNAKEYDKGDEKIIGNYSTPQHFGINGKELYFKLKNNRHYKFKDGLPEKEIMNRLRTRNYNVMVSQHKNADTTEIYRIDFSNA